jgi:hypothetical protein
MANIIYTSYLQHLLSGTVDITDPGVGVYAMLLSGTYTPNTGHSLVSDVSAYEVIDTAGSPVYEQGGLALTSKTAAVVGGEVVFDAADVSWSPSTITASGVALWASGATAADYHLLSWTELGDTSSTNGTFQVVWSPTDGIFKVGVT